jgi:energy-coupling factor transporter ATP-binding protein EcfA2
MSHNSILFIDPEDQIKARNAEMPNHFVDLNLDQIINEIIFSFAEYDLEKYFYFPLSSIDSIYFRHEVFKDIENESIYENVILFTMQMQNVRKYLKLVEKLYYQNQKKIWFLYVAELYCNSVKKLEEYLSKAPIKSRGFLGFYEFLKKYASNSYFISLEDESKALVEDLSNVRYRIIIKDNSFTVQNYEEGIDYSAEIEATFAKFKQGAVKDYLVKYNSVSEDMNHIEAQILDFVAQLNSSLFSRLDNFFTKFNNFIDETISTFDREIHFYISYLQYINKIKFNEPNQTNGKLQFCYPIISNSSKEIYDYDGFDLALAQKLKGLSEKQVGNDKSIVCNDFFLKDKERIIVVTGPNQGGKTTFARMFGQFHYLASLGCLIPGSKAQLFFFDQIYTQFERSEKVENLRGKLEDDLTRVYSILEKATSRSIIIMNEIFNSTTLQDVLFLSKKVMERIIKLDAICVWVTFVDELATFSEKIVSMTSMVVPENPALRTFKIIRRPADGLAYAMAIAQKYRLSFSQIKERIKS